MMAIIGYNNDFDGIFIFVTFEIDDSSILAVPESIHKKK